MALAGSGEGHQVVWWDTQLHTYACQDDKSKFRKLVSEWETKWENVVGASS